MSYPIPREALDDRLAIVGTAGSGKTYLVLGAVEHLLARKSRVICVDPLGVMWGLRLCADGKTSSPFQPVIFGGAHGDLPISEHAGAIIGQAVATSRESCIIDLSLLGTKAAERRFMLAFLTALYRDTDKEPVHLIVDEADMFAPQKLLDKDGDAAKLLGMMETVVRRGRVRGFIPWLITQRPAVLSKDVLSQADGVVALKLTAKQDHDALGGWIEATADKGQWQTIKSALATKQRGEGVIWIPARGILKEADFPEKATFDSSRTPKRGEKITARELKPLDLGALKDKLATVEAEAKANDPKALRTEIGKLKAEIGKLTAAKPAAPVGNLNSEVALKERERVFAAGDKQGYERGWSEGYKAGHQHGFEHGCGRMRQTVASLAPSLTAQYIAPDRAPKPPKIIPENITAPSPVVTSASASRAPNLPSQVKRSAEPAGLSDISAPQRRVLTSIGFWLSVGTASPSRAQVAGVAGYSPSSGGFNNLLGALNTAGLITIPQAGHVALADGAPYDELTPEEARDKVYSVLSNPQQKLVRAALAASDAISRDDLGRETDYSPNSGGFNNLIGSLCTLTIFEKPFPGAVRLSDWAREVLS